MLSHFLLLPLLPPLHIPQLRFLSASGIFHYSGLDRSSELNQTFWAFPTYKEVPRAVGTTHSLIDLSNATALPHSLAKSNWQSRQGTELIQTAVAIAIGTRILLRV